MPPVSRATPELACICQRRTDLTLLCFLISHTVSNTVGLFVVLIISSVSRGHGTSQSVCCDVGGHTYRPWMANCCRPFPRVYLPENVRAILCSEMHASSLVRARGHRGGRNRNVVPRRVAASRRSLNFTRKAYYTSTAEAWQRPFFHAQLLFLSHTYCGLSGLQAVQRRRRTKRLPSPGRPSSATELTPTRAICTSPTP